MGKHDSRKSKKMVRRKGKASKRRGELRQIAVATELRKQGKKTKKLLHAPPPARAPEGKTAAEPKAGSPDTV
ncbi:MAG: hypothetical protein MUF54_04195 [Polyangiaceae bacterium]|jgi:hypothetical protein|nr:hypothetical protein [Polyangiaceae bacterium]